MIYEYEIRQCSVNFGAARREFSRRERARYLRIPKPFWLYLPPFDDLWSLYRNLPSLWSNGIVVWGHIVQANCGLYDEGKDTSPGEVVYCLEESLPLQHLYLQAAALELSYLKGTTPDDPESLFIARYLTDELTRVFGLPVPNSISPHGFQLSTTLFVRKHLPNRRLLRSLLPVIVNPEEPHIVLPLPERYWSEELKQWWTSPTFCFERALTRFSEHPRVRSLSERYRDAVQAVATSKRQGRFDTANSHRETQLEVARDLEILIEGLWREQQA